MNICLKEKTLLGYFSLNFFHQVAQPLNTPSARNCQIASYTIRGNNDNSTKWKNTDDNILLNTVPCLRENCTLQLTGTYNENNLNENVLCMAVNHDVRARSG